MRDAPEHRGDQLATCPGLVTDLRGDDGAADHKRRHQHGPQDCLVAVATRRIGLRANPMRRKVLPIHPAFGRCGFIAAADALGLVWRSAQQPEMPAADKGMTVLMTATRRMVCP